MGSAPNLDQKLGHRSKDDFQLFEARLAGAPRHSIAEIYADCIHLEYVGGGLNCAASKPSSASHASGGMLQLFFELTMTRGGERESSPWACKLLAAASSVALTAA